MIKVRMFFGMKKDEFAEQWARLSVIDQAQLTMGVKDKTLTY